MARASAAPENMSRAMARDSTEVAQAPAAWMTRPVRRPGRSVARPHQTLPAKNTANPDQHRPAPAVAVRDRPDHELAEREYREEDGDGRGDRGTADIQRRRHLRQRRQQDVGRQRAGGGKRRQHRDLHDGGGGLRPGAASIAMVWSAMERVPVLILNYVYHIKRDREPRNAHVSRDLEGTTSLVVIASEAKQSTL